MNKPGGPRRLDRDTLLAERTRLYTMPLTPERTVALRKIGKQLGSLKRRKGGC